jgi:hypothetical protein
MARIVFGITVVSSWAVLVHLQTVDPVWLLVVGTALLLAGPLVRLAVRPVTAANVELPSGPSRLSTMSAASCLSITKAGLATGMLARRTDRLTDRS